MDQHTPSRREILELAGCWVASLALPRPLFGRKRSADRPNIIFILADDLGYGDLGCYGQKLVKTPNLDRMAAEGVRFSQHYAGSTVCAPSRCCLMTGLHTGHCYIRGNRRIDLRPEDVTVAELLRGAGYATAVIGKWGLGTEGGPGVPTRQGFGHFYGYLDQVHAHNYYPEFLIRGEQRVPLRNEVPDHPRWRRGQGKASKRVEYSHDVLVEDALRWIKAQKDRPFFLYLALTIPHANNEAGAEGMEVPELEPYADRDWPAPARGFAAMVHRMDADVGRVLALPKQLEIDQQTVVFFSSDNGPHREGGHDPAFFDSNGPLRGIKRDLYEGGIRVPFIARWPGRIKPGSISDHVSTFWDFLPTCAELAGIEPPDDIDGISYLPTLLGQSQDQPKHECLYWEFHERGGKQAVRWGDWKGVRLNVNENPDGPIELYNLKDDVGEQCDVAAEHSDIVRRIEKTMIAERRESAEFPFR